MFSLDHVCLFCLVRFPPFHFRSLVAALKRTIAFFSPSDAFKTFIESAQRRSLRKVAPLPIWDVVLRNKSQLRPELQSRGEPPPNRATTRTFQNAGGVTTT